VSALAAAALALLAGATGGEVPVRVPRMASAALQAEHARAVRQRFWGTEGEARERARAEAVAAFRAVRAYFPRARRSGAEAAFRAGELLRAAGRSSDAREEFAEAARLGEGTPFGARAVLQLGHLARHAGDGEGALALYGSLEVDRSASQRVRASATLWSGRVHAEAGRADAARRCWRRVAIGAEHELDRVRAYDELALSWIERGDLEAAAAVLQECRDALADRALEQSARGARLRGAVSRMRSLARLRHAVEVRMRRARDARASEAR
jgi:tetratricopeptide (TPR) repeat protein